MKKMAMKTVIVVAALTLAFGVTSQAFAFGWKVEIKTENDTFDNSGKIIGTQSTSGGVANQFVGQRARAYQLDGFLTYTSKNNTYKNSGKIIGTQTTTGGVANQTVAQEIY